MTRTTRSTSPDPATPSAPTPVAPDLLAGIMSRRELPRTHRGPAVLLAPSAPTAPARAKTAPATTGFPILPIRSRVAGSGPLPAGWVWAIRRSFANGQTNGVGYFRAFANAAAVLPSTDPGTRFDTYHGRNSADCGMWEVLASAPDTEANKQVLANMLSPRPTAS
jgi:hypothetical protein